MNNNCPHCGKRIQGRGAPKHIGQCPLNPDVFETYRTFLDNGYGEIISSHFYLELSSAGDFPLFRRTALVHAFGGTWEAVALFFGLEHNPGKSSGRPRKDDRPGLNGLDETVKSMFNASAEAVAYWEEFLDFPVCRTYTNRRGEVVRGLGSNGLAWRNQYRNAQRQGATR